MHVVRRLRRGPERQLAVGAEVGDRGVLLQRAGACCPRRRRGPRRRGRRAAKPSSRVAELQRDELVDVAGVAVVVDRRARPARGRPRSSRSDGSGSYSTSIEIERVEGRVLVDRRDGRDRIADEAHAVGAERVLVLRDGKDAERDRQVLARRDRDDAGRGERLRDVDRDDARVRDLRAQQLAVQHPRQHQVVGELRLARCTFAGAVDLRVGAADDAGLRAAAVIARRRVDRQAARSRRSRTRTGSPRAARRPRRASRRRRARRPRRS